MEVDDKLHAQAALAPGKSPRYPLGRGWGSPRTDLDAVE
jgi:hypothetical protein